MSKPGDYTPAGHSSRQTPADHSSRQTPAGHSSRQTPADHSSRQIPAGRSSRQLSARTLSLVGFSVLMSVSAQLSLRHGMAAHQSESGLELFVAAFQSFWVLAGISGYLLATVTWLMVLRRIDLVVAYPLGSLNFVFVTLFSALLLGEHVPLLRWAGILVILAGILVVARGERVAAADAVGSRAP